MALLFHRVSRPHGDNGVFPRLVITRRALGESDNIHVRSGSRDFDVDRYTARRSRAIHGSRRATTPLLRSHVDRDLRQTRASSDSRPYRRNRRRTCRGIGFSRRGPTAPALRDVAVRVVERVSRAAAMTTATNDTAARSLRRRAGRRAPDDPQTDADPPTDRHRRLKNAAYAVCAGLCGSSAGTLGKIGMRVDELFGDEQVNECSLFVLLCFGVLFITSRPRPVFVFKIVFEFPLRPRCASTRPGSSWWPR